MYEEPTGKTDLFNYHLKTCTVSINNAEDKSAKDQDDGNKKRNEEDQLQF